MAQSRKNVFVEIWSNEKDRKALIVGLVLVVATVFLTLLVEPVRIAAGNTYEHLFVKATPKEAALQSTTPPPAQQTPSPAHTTMPNGSGNHIMNINGSDNTTEFQDGQGNHQNSPDYSQHIGTQYNRAHGK